jgi:nitroreductase
VELTEVLHARRMVRRFADRPVDPALVRRLLVDALRSPTAGHTRGTDFVVLSGPQETAGYWEAATTSDWRARSARFGGLSGAPVIVLSLTSPEVYLNRYSEPDKSGSRLGAAQGERAWPVPYWFGDAAFATMALLLGATDAHLASAFLGNFRQEAAVLRSVGAPEGWRLFGTVLIGHAEETDRRSRSLDRQGPTIAARIHVGRW